VQKPEYNAVIEISSRLGQQCSKSRGATSTPSPDQRNLDPDSPEDLYPEATWNFSKLEEGRKDARGRERCLPIAVWAKTPQTEEGDRQHLEKFDCTMQKSPPPTSKPHQQYFPVSGPHMEISITNHGLSSRFPSRQRASTTPHYCPKIASSSRSHRTFLTTHLHSSKLFSKSHLLAQLCASAEELVHTRDSLRCSSSSAQAQRYCGIWSIKCRQGSKTNKSNIDFGRR
jgi:hypothetical protein